MKGEFSLVCAAHNMKKMVKAMTRGLIRPDDESMGGSGELTGENGQKTIYTPKYPQLWVGRTGVCWSLGNRLDPLAFFEIRILQNPILGQPPRHNDELTVLSDLAFWEGNLPG